MGLAAALQHEELVTIQADTLIYFEAPTESAIGKTIEVLRKANSDSLKRTALHMVEQIFADYRNHYSENPLLKQINISSAYQDWVLTATTNRRASLFLSADANGRYVGICLLDESKPSWNEILLAGIVPGRRGEGLYQEMLIAVLAHSKSRGKPAVVISTQASNLTAMRAWIRTGFLPVQSLNTFHVHKKKIFV